MRERLARLLTLVVLVATGLSVVATPAGADVIPPTNWTPASLSAVSTATNVMTHLDGGVTVGCVGGSNATVFQSYSSSGSVTQSGTIYSYPTPEVCSNSSAVGADGTLYTYAWHNHAPVIQAIKNGILVWSYNPSCGRYINVHDMTIGPDGNVYLVLNQGTNGCSPFTLIGLSADAQPNTTEPTQLFKVGVSGDVRSGGLAVYNDGLAVFKWTEIEYFSFSGSSVVAVAHGNEGVPYREHFDATLSGRVFVATKADSAQSFGCNSPSQVMHSISAIESSGYVWGPVPLPSCSQVVNLRPTFSGGVVAHLLCGDPLDTSQCTDKIRAYDRFGNVLWTKLYGNGVESTIGIETDLNGNVALRRFVMVKNTINGSLYKFPEVRFELINGNTGQTISGTEFALRGDSTTTSGPSYIPSEYEARISKGVAYVIASECTYHPQCNWTPKLYAFTVPGLEIDYPRGAVLRANEPWLNYVALGDSFSSGQGVTPYQAGTDTAGPPENRCRRSDQAYSKLLDGNPSARLNLTAFVACGGAETTHVINGKFTEGPQINALSTSTDVVTITVGGNDIGFGPLVRACVLESDCTQGSDYAYTINALQNTLPGSLDALFAQIAPRIGQQTRVLVVGYPMLVPDASTSTTWPNCAYLNSDEKTAARQIVTDLNQALHDAADRAGARFEYVDVNGSQSPFRGHELCNDGSYFYGVTAAEEARYHPNLAGQDVFRQIILTYL